MPSQCTGTTKSGKPCGATVWRDGLCRWHHPDLEEKRAADRRAGGLAKSNAVRARKQLRQSAMSLQEIDGLLCDTMVKIAEGKASPGIGKALGTLARAVIAVRHAGDLEERVHHLEQSLGEQKGA